MSISFAFMAPLLRLGMTGDMKTWTPGELPEGVEKMSWDDLKASENRELWGQLTFQTLIYEGEKLVRVREFAREARAAREEVLADPDRSLEEKRAFMNLVRAFVNGLPRPDDPEETGETEGPTSWDDLRSPGTIYAFFGHVDWDAVEDALDRKRRTMEIDSGLRGLWELTPEEQVAAKRAMEKAVLEFRRKTLKALAAVHEPSEATLRDLLTRLSS